MKTKEGNPLICLSNLNKSYKLKAGEFKALDNLSLEIDKGDFIIINGKSGSGKSTLLNMVNGIDKPSAGEVWVMGQPVHALSEEQAAYWRGRHVGVVFQFFQLLPNLTILQNVMLPMDFCGIGNPRQRKERAYYLLEKMGISSHGSKIPTALSGGEQQRAAIARALANSPSIITADEPTGNLDSETSEAVMNIFQDLVKDGTTVVMVSHETGYDHVGRQVSIHDGRIK